MKRKNVSPQKRMVASYTSNWWITQIKKKLLETVSKEIIKQKQFVLKETGLHIIFKITKNILTLSYILMDAEPTIRKECYSTGRLRWAGRTWHDYWKKIYRIVSWAYNL